MLNLKVLSEKKNVEKVCHETKKILGLNIVLGKVRLGKLIFFYYLKLCFEIYVLDLKGKSLICYIVVTEFI